MINIKRMFVGRLESCCYIVNTDRSSDCILIDPGGDADDIVAYCNGKGLKPALLINTHGHGDHIGANRELKGVYPELQIHVHVDDGPMLTNEYLNLSLLGGKRYTSPPADHLLRDDDRILFDDIKLSVIHVPGHTPGGICLLCHHSSCTDDVTTFNGEDGRLGGSVVFTGDSLFNGGIGRTDLPKGDFELLVGAIRGRLLALHGDTMVCPGHGETTTIARERETNPFVASGQAGGGV